MKKGKVVGQSKDDDVNIIGKYESNPILNTMYMMSRFLMDPSANTGQIY